MMRKLAEHLARFWLASFVSVMQDQILRQNNELRYERMKLLSGPIILPCRLLVMLHCTIVRQI